MRVLCLLYLSAMAALQVAYGFVPGAGLSTGLSVTRPRQGTEGRNSVVCMGIWDAIKAGFENEQIDTPIQNAGLKNGPQTVKITFLPQKRVVEAVAGQKLSDVTSAARIPIKYDCKKGQCGTCEVQLNGKTIRTCVSIVPRNLKEVTIKL